MKRSRLICCLAALLSMLGVVAQTRPVYDVSYPEHLIELKSYVAIGNSTIIENYRHVIPGLSDIQMAASTMMRAGTDVRFALRRSLALCTGMSFDISNSRYALSLVDGKTGSINSIFVKNHFYELTIPVYVSFRFNMGRALQSNLDFGTYFAFGVSGKMKGRGYTSGENSLGQPVINQVAYESDYFNDPRSLINGVRDFDWGPRLASGVAYRHHYTVNVVFEVGVPNLAINQGVIDVKYRNMSLAFEFGYTF